MPDFHPCTSIQNKFKRVRSDPMALPVKGSRIAVSAFLQETFTDAKLNRKNALESIFAFDYRLRLVLGFAHIDGRRQW